MGYAACHRAALAAPPRVARPPAPRCSSRPSWSRCSGDDPATTTAPSRRPSLTTSTSHDARRRRRTRPPLVDTELPTRGRTRRTVATDLDVPWALAFLPDGSALVTLRDKAQLLQVRRRPGAPVVLGGGPRRAPRRRGRPARRRRLPRLRQRPQHLRLLHARRSDNRVVRLTFADGRPTEPTVVLRGIPKAGNHNGGRLAFGPDGFLYVTTGDAGESDRAAGQGARSAARSCGSPRTASRRRATRSATPRSGATATATCRASPGRRTGGCTPASSARTPGTS